MKNKLFADYVTGVAFCLTLTKRQCWGLLALLDRKQDHWLHSGQFVSIGHSLRARGLIVFSERNAQRRRKRKFSHSPNPPVWKLTQAGKYVVGLLREAGFSMRNTRTLSVIKGEDLWFRNRPALP